MNSSSIRIEIPNYMVSLSKKTGSTYIDITIPVVLKYNRFWRYLWVHQIMTSAFFTFTAIIPLSIQIIYKDTHFLTGFFALLITFYIVVLITNSAIANFFVKTFEDGEIIHIDERGFIDRRVSDELIIWECVEESKRIKTAPSGVAALKVKLRKELSGRRRFRLERLVELIFPLRAKSLIVGVQHLELKSYIVIELFLAMSARFRETAEIKD